MDNLSVPRLLTDLFEINKNQNNYEWESFKEGIEIYRIYEENAKGASAALLRYARGAEAPMHIHTGFEHILILSGSQTDGVRIYSKGMLIISEPGTQHRIVSETGCIALAIWQSPVKFTNLA